VAAEFRPQIETLAFPIVGASERDLREIRAEPLPLVVETLIRDKTIEQVFENLPDIEVIQANPYKATACRETTGS